MACKACTLLFAVPVVAVAVWMAWPRPPLGLSTLPIPTEYNVSSEQMQQYREDGYLIFPGLFSGPALAEMVADAERVTNSSSPWDMLFKKAYSKVQFDAWRQRTPFAKVAFESPMPHIAHQLLVQGDAEEAGDLRILRDAVFAYTTGGSGCGWHVDDRGFWPANDDSNGVTFWVALSYFSPSEGGGLALATGSHRAEWAKECREVITGDTCNMKELSPKCWEVLDNSKAAWVMKPGDVLAWGRWTFHRTDQFKDLEGNEGPENGAAAGQKMRYSIRYMTQNARAEGLVHPSVKQGEPFESPYYPRAWPEPLESEMKLLKSHGLDSDLGMRATAGIAWFKLKKTASGWFQGSDGG